MDFIFALFPWFITWKLNLKRAEKVGLCITLSLGIVVAVITAVRTWWKDTPLMHVHDEWYIWRDAMSQIWFVHFPVSNSSAETASPPPPKRQARFSFPRSWLTSDDMLASGTSRLGFVLTLALQVLRRGRRHHHRAVHPRAAALRQGPAHLVDIAEAGRHGSDQGLDVAREHAAGQEGAGVHPLPERRGEPEEVWLVRAVGDPRGAVACVEIRASRRCILFAIRSRPSYSSISHEADTTEEGQCSELAAVRGKPMMGFHGRLKSIDDMHIYPAHSRLNRA